MTYQHVHENDDHKEREHKKKNLVDIGWIVVIVEVAQKHQEENADETVSKFFKSTGFKPPVIIPRLRMVIIGPE